MGKGGGTWRIVVEEGATSRPTQSRIVAGGKKSVQSKIKGAGDKEAKDKSTQGVQMGLLTGVAISRAAFNQYYSITGQGARRNTMNATLVYGAAVASIGIQLAKGNFVGAAVATIGTGVALGTQYVNFQKNITEQNAMAEYLRQQSGTSVNGNRGEFYNFRLF